MKLEKLTAYCMLFDENLILYLEERYVDKAFEIAVKQVITVYDSFT